MPCPNLIYILTCARTHACTHTQSIANSTRKHKRTQMQINARKLIVAFDVWAISACKRVCVLRVRYKTFRMYYSSNFRPIRARVSRSIVDKLWPITEASTADLPLTLTLSARSHAMAALWTSLVAWSSTLLTC